MAEVDQPREDLPADPAGETAPIHPLRRRGLALLLPVLAVCTAALVPVGVDCYKLAQREPGLGLWQLLHAGILIAGLESLVALALGLLGGLALVILVRQRDLSQAAGELLGQVLRLLRIHQRRPESGATILAAGLALLVFLGAAYQLSAFFFATFKNRQLAALLLSCLLMGLLLVCLLIALVLRIPLTRLTRGLSRVPGIRVLVTVIGIAALLLLALAAVALYLLLSYLPIVRMIDWRPLSYPGMTLGVGGALLALLLWRRGRRLRRGRAAGRLRVALLALWVASFPLLWAYCLVTFGEQTVVRAAILRRAYGATRSFDLLSWTLDFDGDGHLSVFGGNDCAPFDANVHPGAPEIPNNGIDDNCYGGDLRTERQDALRRFDHPLPPALAGKRPNLVLITLDGLRADHVSAYGYHRPTTPNIDALARQGVLFERAYAQAPSTRYSIPSFLSSRYFSQIPRKGGTEIPEPILPEALLMAEVLKEGGYRTGAALSYHVFERSWGVDQGFDFYDLTQSPYYSGKGTPSWDKDKPYVLLDAARKFLTTKSDRPYFLWVHFFEPHPPYVHRTKPRDFGTTLVDQYDGELCFADEKVGQLLEMVRATRGPTVIILGADHGREFGEHGTTSHGYDVHMQSLHVPLIVQGPGVPPRRIKNPVAMLDVLPTLTNLAGIKKRFLFEGESLVPQVIRGKENAADRPIFSEVQVGFHDSHVINAITTRDFKLIYDVTFNTYQLYDLRTDPEEKKDASAERPADLQRLKGLLHQMMERATLPNIEEEIHSNLIAAAPATPGVTRVNFDNQIEFLGFSVNPERPRAGEILTITWYLKSLVRTRVDYKFVVRLQGSRGATFDAKHIPIRGQYPSTKWEVGAVIRDLQHMRLPPQPQEYEVWLGFASGHDFLKPTTPLKLVNTAVLVGKFSTF